MRNTFIQSILELRRSRKDVFLLVGDLGYSVIEPFQEEFPDSFYNIGVAEQNMAGIAAGLASEGGLVFCYSIGNFNTFRCAEQIRNDIDYHNFSVCMVTVGGGLAYGNMGYSHHAIQDYALMRSFPNILICAPCDPLETSLCLDLIVSRSAPSYLRLHKGGEPTITDSREPVVPGQPRLTFGSDDSDLAVLATGYAAQGIFARYRNRADFAFYTMPAWGMNHRGYLLEFAARFKKIITIEDHLRDGGFGSWFLEGLSGTDCVSKVCVKALLPEMIGIVGAESYLHELCDLFSLDFG